MYNPEVLFSTDDYILTSTRNIISRNATIHKPSALEIPLGRCFIAHGVVIRADLAQVQIQKYTFIGQGTVLQPCSMSNDPLKHIPLSIGSHCSIGQRCTVEAAVIGIGCSIGDDCNLSKRWNSIHLSESKAGDSNGSEYFNSGNVIEYLSHSNQPVLISLSRLMLFSAIFFLKISDLFLLTSTSSQMHIERFHARREWDYSPCRYGHPSFLNRGWITR